MKEENEYLKNTLILFIGKFSTQFISIILLPIFTNFLTVTDFGIVDLIQIYINLIVPVIILCIDNAIFRFLIDNRKEEKKINELNSNVLFFTLLQAIIVIIFSMILKNIIQFEYYYIAVINVIVMMFYSVGLQICRGLGKNKEYSIATIIISILNLIVNLLLIIVVKYNASSILIASSIANLIGFMYMMNKCKVINNLSFKTLKKSVLAELLKYSLPIIPNVLSWWIINVSDRTIISWIISTAANGIYTISCKFSNIINSIFSIFLMSWQETASIHINDKNREQFFSKTIQEILNIFICLVILLLSAMPLIFPILIGNDYMDAFNYVPILLIGCIFSIYTSILGGIYIALKKTTEVAKTSIIASILNIVINLLCIKYIGIYAACVSTVMSYLIMSIYRYFDIKKYISLSFNKKSYLILFGFLLVNFVVYYYNNIFLSIIMTIINLILTFYMNKNIINDFRVLIMKKIKKNKQ